MPSRPFADSAVIDFLGTKIVRDDLLLRSAPAFLDLRIVVIGLGHRSIRFFELARRAACGPPQANAATVDGRRFASRLYVYSLRWTKCRSITAFG